VTPKWFSGALIEDYLKKVRVHAYRGQEILQEGADRGSIAMVDARRAVEHVGCVHPPRALRLLRGGWPRCS
jgi:hypothetical protein